MPRLPIANPLLDNYGTFDPMFVVNPYSFVPAGGGAFDPSAYGTPVLWLKADDISGSDGDPVATWPKDTYGSDATQATSGSRPTLQTSELNGHSVVRLDGSDDKMATGSITLGSIFIVAKYSASTFGTFNGLITGTGGADSDIILVGNNGGSTGWYSGGGVVSNYRKNGVSLAVNASGSGPMNAFAVMYGEGSYSTAVQLGADRNNGGRNWLGDIAEVLLFSAALSTGNREAVEDYLGAKYGITITH